MSNADMWVYVVACGECFWETRVETLKEVGDVCPSCGAWAVTVQRVEETTDVEGPGLSGSRP